jgi:hypothetical protein
MHQRQVIRDAVVQRLTGATPAGSRVTVSQVDPYRTGDLPALTIYTPSDTTDLEQTTQQVLWSDLDLEIVGWVVDRDASPAQNQMDAIAEAITAAMDADLFLGGACGDKGATLQSTEMVIVAEMDGKRFDAPRGLIKLTYSIPYTTNRFPTATVNDFATAQITTQANGVAENNVITDTITEPT